MQMKFRSLALPAALVALVLLACSDEDSVVPTSEAGVDASVAKDTGVVGDDDDDADSSASDAAVTADSGQGLDSGSFVDASTDSAVADSGVTDSGVADSGTCANQTLTVTNNGASSYVINSANNPSLTLCRGSTYTFNLSVSGHPFWIKTVQGTGTGNGFAGGGLSANGQQTGAVTFTVPAGAPNTLFYNCEFHGGMTGTISIIN